VPLDLPETDSSVPDELTTRCLLCGGAELEVLTRTLRYGEGTVVLCPRCRLGALDVPAEDLRRYYDEEYRNLHGPRVGQRAEYDEIFETYVRYMGNRIELLRAHLFPSTRLLEVGCSTGHFLHEVAPLVGEVTGIDYDAGAAAYAAERVGCKTYSGDLADTDLEPGSFDVVCAYQVMEHVADPVAFAAELRRYVKPGGIVLVEVPNLDDPLLRIYENEAYRRFYFHKAHLWYFTAAPLLEVMRRGGLSGRVVAAQDYNFTNHLHWALRGEPQPDPHAGLGAAQLPVGPGAPQDAAADLRAWAAKADAEYKAILARHGITDNIAFVGTPAEPA
jgi:2-polyprenyl-3-methyl-5-hydroxy-6-metoxy-1,4-benzoquinol methylase